MNAELISDLEACERRAYWSKDWESNRLHPTEILRRAIAEALTDEDRTDRGELAGELVMGYAGDRGVAIQSSHKYDIVLHYSSIADILTTFLARKGVYSRPDPKVGVNLRWDPYCLQRGQELVRVVLVDYLGEDRQASEARSWFTLGEMAAYKMPMNLEIFMLGASSGHKRHSAWTKGLLHPRNMALRFKKQAKKVEGFKETWVPIYREDHAEISRETWLETMEADGVLADVAKMIHIDRLPEERIQELRRIVERKTGRLYQVGELPDPNYSACDWPRPCPFRGLCFGGAVVGKPEQGDYRRRILAA